MVAQASIDSQTSAVIRQMATELAQLKMQMNANARQQPPLPNQLAGLEIFAQYHFDGLKSTCNFKREV